jgi:preprotein translocase subunit SecD
MNQYPTWKYLLLAVVLVMSVLFALPNLFGEDPAVQISPKRGGSIDAALVARIVARMEEAGLSLKGPPEATGNRLLLRFLDEESQLQAQDVAKEMLARQFVVALNLAPATPDWLSSLGALPMYLGLDLRGGVHFLMEVDMEAAVSQAEGRYLGDIKTLLRTERVRYSRATKPDGEDILLRFKQADTRDKAYGLIRSEFPDLDVSEQDSSDGFELRARMSESAAKETRDFALDQNITTLRRRVNELGVAEPLIQQQGVDRIVIQLPGVQDTVQAKNILGGTATLEFRMVHQTGDVQAALDGRVPIDAKLYTERNGRPILLKRDVMLTGEYITDAASGLDQQSGSPAVFITLDGQGAGIFSKATREQIGNPMGVVFIEHKTEFRIVNGVRVKERSSLEEVINVATIRDQLSKRFQITGLDSTEEARNLALLLRAGALAAPIAIVEERTVGPSLGQENINQGLWSVLIAFSAVLVFMAVYYRTFGLVANIALAFNLVLIVSVLSMLQATLTLPGIAGIVLTVGMAVDANVLIFERIREEVRNGNTPQASIHAGYEKALSTIADANVTTLIAAIVLFGFGTGPVKGFAITLSIGIVASMFTAIMGTRAIINLIYGGRRVSALSI